MKKHALLLLILVINLSYGCSDKSSLSHKVDEVTKDYLANHFLNSTFMFCEGDKTLEVGAKGIRSQDGQQLKANEKMPVASVTKSMTAAAILKLQDKGLLNVNDKISRHLGKESNIWTEGKMPAWADEIELHHLLTHTSGLPEYFMAVTPDLTKPLGEIIRDIANFAAAKDLSFEPGSKYQYTNTNYTLLGLIIEKVSGASLEQFFAQEFFTPLGMESTSLISLEEAVKFQQEPEATEYPVRYFVTPTGAAPRFTEVQAKYIMVPFADGGVVSSTSDLIKWQRALHNGKVLSGDAYKLMTAKYYQIPVKTGVKNYTGYGIFISELENGDIVYNNSGSAIAIRAETGYIPSRNFYYALISNVMNHLPKEMEGQIDMSLPENQLDIHYFLQAIFKGLVAK